VPEIEQHVAVDSAPLVDLRLLRARDDVAACELHRVRRVPLEEALAAGVEEIGAFAAAALSDEDARGRERRRVELHHLHVLERDADAECHRHPVAGAGVRVRRPRVEAARSAGGEDDRLRADRLQTAVEKVPADHTLAAAVVLDEQPREVLVVHAQVALHHLLVEDVDEDVPGDVGRVRRARLAGCPEGTLRDAPVLGPREHSAPVLELVDVVRRLVAENLNRVLIAEVVRALDGVVGVLLWVVLGRVPERRVNPAFGRAGVAADGMDLGDERDVGALVVSLDSRAHAGTTGTDDEHVVLGFHWFGRYTNGLRGCVELGPVTDGDSYEPPRAGAGRDSGRRQLARPCDEGGRPRRASLRQEGSGRLSRDRGWKTARRLGAFLGAARVRPCRS
jgi:hypothetical protein